MAEQEGNGKGSNMVSIIYLLIQHLFATGGLLRVRALLALALTVGGVLYVLLNLAMPPGEYNVLWGMAIAYYFATRGAVDGSAG